MPQSLSVNTSQLRLHGAALDSVNGDSTGQLTANASALAGCQAGWVGSTFLAFEQLRDTWERADAARAERLDDIAMNLLRAADDYDHGDESGAAGVAQTM